MNLAIAVALAVIILTLGLTYNGDYRWVGHALVSIVGLVTLGGMALTGIRLVGRSGSQGVSLFKRHRTMGIFFTILMMGTFFYGIWVALGRGESFWSNILHAGLGVSLVALAFAQLIPSLIMKRTSALRVYHRIIGYALAILVLEQVIMGVYMVLTGS